jgi:hypothetical protein
MACFLSKIIRTGHSGEPKQTSVAGVLESSVIRLSGKCPVDVAE